MSMSEKIRKVRVDTNYDSDQYEYIQKIAKRRNVPFTQVVRELLKVAIKSRKRS